MVTSFLGALKIDVHHGYIKAAQLCTIFTHLSARTEPPSIRRRAWEGCTQSLKNSYATGGWTCRCRCDGGYGVVGQPWSWSAAQPPSIWRDRTPFRPNGRIGSAPPRPHRTRPLARVPTRQRRRTLDGNVELTELSAVQARWPRLDRLPDGTSRAQANCFHRPPAAAAPHFNGVAPAGPPQGREPRAHVCHA
ncbi:hypothetical protein F1D59_36460 [Streptomyces sp. INR7]|nr:hypothetical protein F1D59_36460 [Streptomyces sp. INR7]